MVLINKDKLLKFNYEHYDLQFTYDNRGEFITQSAANYDHLASLVAAFGKPLRCKIVKKFDPNKIRIFYIDMTVEKAIHYLNYNNQRKKTISQNFSNH